MGVVSIAGPVRVCPANGNLTDRSGTIATGGTAQNAMGANAARRYLFVTNPETAGEQGIATAEPLDINLTGTATTSPPSVRLAPGASFVMEAGFVSKQALSVRGATTGHKFAVWEG